MSTNARSLNLTYDALLWDIRERIQPVCEGMPAEEFSALTKRMADIEWKYSHMIDVTPDTKRGRTDDAADARGRTDIP